MTTNVKHMLSKSKAVPKEVLVKMNMNHADVCRF